MRELIVKQNPWWEGKKDYHIEVWRSMKVRWIPKWIEKVSTDPFSLNFVIGPRQTGKTTGIKLLISRLLEKVDGEQILYFDCTLLPDASSLRRVMDEYLDRREFHQSMIFLDEVTSVSDWWRVVKGYVDMGVFKHDVITVTGSSSLRLRGNAELFPGRRGMGKDITVLPLSFGEFLGIRKIELDLSGKLKDRMHRARKMEDKIMREFELYLKLGGFPLSINEDPQAEASLISSIEGEILRAGKSLELSRAILSSIFSKAPSPISFSTIGRDVGVSYKTVQEYIQALRNLFVLEVALFKDERVKWRKERKFFFLDHFLARTLSMWAGEEFLQSALYEWIVQSHMWRKYGSVYYFRNNFEIDCISGDLRVEVKLGKPHRRYPDDVMVLDSTTLPTFLAVL